MSRPGAFKKGQSGNPGGRPKAVKAVEETAREHTPLAMDTLAEVCRNKKAPPAARVSAASVLLDRGWGKARQDVKVTGTVDVRKLDDLGLDQALRGELAAFLGGLGQGSDIEADTTVAH